MGIFDKLFGKKSKDGQTALMCAAERGHTKIAEMLLTGQQSIREVILFPQLKEKE